MARMLPPLSDGFVFRSEAERTVYHWLSESAPNQWVAIHSVWLKNANRKEHAEIDFLLITDSVFLCLEVKGHKVWRDASGSWNFETLDGSKSEIRNEGPFDQAKEAYYAVRNTLSKFQRFDLFNNRIWGYGVITPDCALDFRKGDGWLSPAMLIDKRVFPEDGLNAITKLEAFWSQEHLSQKQKLGHSQRASHSPPESDKLELLQIFRPKIDVIEGPAIDAKSSIREANVLTEEQIETLSALSQNPRIILRGLAGTGKTMMAVEQARIKQTVSSVLFVCFNRNLAEELAAQAELRDQGNVTYLNYHQLVSVIITRAGLKSDVPEDWSKFNDIVDDLVLHSLDILGDSFTPYDYLVVDEAQDLMNSKFFSVLDLLVEGGIKRGSWLIALDPSQTLYEDQFEDQLLEQMLNLGVQLNLTKNCRNTRQIASYVAGISSITPERVRSVEGPQVEIDYFEDFSEYEKVFKKYLNSYIAGYRKANICLSEVVVLVSDRRFIEELSKDVSEKLLAPLVPLYAQRKKDALCWSSIHGFKGLEATAVIVVFNGDIDDLEQKRLFYVAGSRARANLIALIPSSAEGAINRALPRVLQLLNS